MAISLGVYPIFRHTQISDLMVVKCPKNSDVFLVHGLVSGVRVLDVLGLMGKRPTGTTGFIHQFLTGRPHLVVLTEIQNQPEGIGYTSCHGMFFG